MKLVTGLPVNHQIFKFSPTTMRSIAANDRLFFFIDLLTSRHLSFPIGIGKTDASLSLGVPWTG